MNRRTFSAFLLSLCLVVGLVGAESPSTLHMRVLALGERGVADDLALGEWKIQVGGRDVKVFAQRTPKETASEGKKWVFLFLPLRDPEVRRAAVQSVASFMSTLPVTDSVLVVARTAKGLECLTPGFTTRPSLWAKSLDRVIAELPAKLEGRSAKSVVLPPSPVAEPEEGMEPIRAFLADLPGRKLEQRADDRVAGRRSIMESYAAGSLGSYAEAVTATLTSMEHLGEALAKVTGEKQLVVFSRNEIDDLANPVWAKNVNKIKPDELNSRFQVELMVRDITLGRVSLAAKLTQLGLTIHSVGGGGAGYAGAFGEAAQATGGYQYQCNDVAARLPQMLPLWAARYELEVTLPAGLARPDKSSVETTRKNLRIYASSVW